MNWMWILVPRGDWVATYPSTNGRLVVGIRIAQHYVYVTMGIVVARCFFVFELPEWAISFMEMVGWFIGGAVLTTGVAQFIGKRATAKADLQPTISETVTAEGATPPKIVPKTLDKDADK